MSREEFYKRHPRIFPEESKFLEEMEDKGVVGERLLKEFGGKFPSYDFKSKILISEVTKKISRREREILLQMLTGKSNKDIAYDMELSEDAVGRYIENIFKIFGDEKENLGIETDVPKLISRLTG